MFQIASQKEKRGKFMRTGTLFVPSGPYTKMQALEKCKKKCEGRLKCCNVCTKVAHDDNIWSCTLYYGKFGGLDDLTIEEASYVPDVDEICAFKNTDRFCLA